MLIPKGTNEWPDMALDHITGYVLEAMHPAAYRAIIRYVVTVQMRSWVILAKTAFTPIVGTAIQ